MRCIWELHPWSRRWIVIGLRTGERSLLVFGQNVALNPIRQAEHQGRCLVFPTDVSVRNEYHSKGLTVIGTQWAQAEVQGRKRM